MIAGILSAGYGLANGSKQAEPTPTPEQATFFETRIRPVLANNCFVCHGEKSQASGLRLDSRASLLKGGDSGPAIVAGDPEKKSLLLKVIHQTGAIKMPPGGKKLAANEIADIEAWIKMGAPWPTPGSTPKTQADLWSLHPVSKPPIPAVKTKSWVRNPIDAFILAKLETSISKPAAEADKRTLIRRVTYDLTGLPPTPEEVDAFVADKSPTAYDKVVDRLLASPRYGERSARHWMDVARYADTKGYVFEEDRTYHNAYTYRDWVIQSFNRDLPYDQFVMQQLAADRLPEIMNGDDKSALAALGFLTIGRRFLNSQPDIIDDRIDVTMRGLQGLTVSCARCHDHKFDPIPTQDYYSLYAVFNSSDEKASPISAKAIRDPWEENNQKVVAAQTSIRELVLTQVANLRKKNDATTEVKDALAAFREGAIPEGDTLAKVRKGFDPAEQQRLMGLQKTLESLEKNAPPTPEIAMAMVDRANPSDGYVFKRGNPGVPGQEAPRRFLAALSKGDRPHWTEGSGRLELAKSIGSRDNPLTARVFVNRVWQDHFGAGLVRTPSDFGHQGEKPTHPELLDYLASSFMESGWSVKKLHRLIVTSATYRQSSSVSAAAFNKDPENRTWNRMNRRRLDFEEMRDSLVSASGHLDGKVGGKSVDLWDSPYTPRRAVYGFIERQNLPGIFRTFDLASPDSTNARRFQTTVPQQALFFMNSPFTVGEAESVALRSELVTASGDASRVRRLYRILLERMPDADELASGLAYLQRGAVEAPTSPWQYGYGGFDGSHVVGFTPLTAFVDQSYQVGKAFPDPTLGYLILKAQGGHPGHDGAHAVIRRWVAPAAAAVDIRGLLSHGQAEGDGVRARLVSSRAGLIGEWTAHKSEAATVVSGLSVVKGETLDFVVDPIGSDGYDAFGWSPSIRSVDGKLAWEAGSGFGPPAGPALSRLALYAQALMMTNEFMFVD